MATEPAMGFVGIFWVVAEGSRTQLIADKTPLHLAEAYGDCLTSPVGHYEHWTALQRLPARSLQRWLGTTAPLHHEYEHWPRGRAVLHLPSQRFIVYADAQLHQPRFVREIAQAFDLPPDRYDLLRDDHYRHTLQLPTTPPSDPP